jgi:hypothetical protein
MKTIIIFFLLFISFSLRAQSIGGLLVKSTTNLTNNLSDNKLTDSTIVRIVNIGLAIDTTICFSKTNNYRINLGTGKYNLTCIAGENSIELQDVIISGDRITLVELLFEPKAKLNFVERRKRKNLYYNF